ncbi:MAG: polyamine aminopropyltransferase [Pseudomonadota bacterium]
MAERWIEETFHPHWRVALKASKILHEEKTAHQDLVIFENETWGTVLMLDGVVQLSIADDGPYHEMMAHVPLMALRKPKRVLIIGGGDGGVLREVLKHSCVEQATLVEIDRSVIDLSLKYFPSVSDGAFDDTRAEVVITDGLAFVAEQKNAFDAIIVDSSEPIGPSAVLHTKAFFAECKTALTEGGVLVSQNGLPFLFPDHLAGTTRVFQSLFKRVAPYLCQQPCYFGGPFALNLATDDKAILKTTEQDLTKRAIKRSVSGLSYWTPGVHLGAFALPANMAETVTKAKADAKAGDDSGYTMPEPEPAIAVKPAKKGAAKKSAVKKAVAKKTAVKKAGAKRAASKKAPVKTQSAKTS